jgi:diguanylate cyclase (GGDEF)-like protein/PAS domain S-box-containing protein
MGEHGALNRLDLLAVAVEHLGPVSAGAGLILHDREGRIAAANDAAETILGLSFDQLQGRTSADPRWAVIDADGHFVAPERRPAKQALLTGRPVYGYVVGVHRPSVDATAEHVWILGSSQPIFDGPGSVASSVITAFTVLGGSEGALLRITDSERHYRWVAENASDMVAVLAPDTTHLWVSPSCRALTGHTPDEMVGQTIWEFVHPVDLPGVRAAVEAIRPTGTARLDLTYRFRCADGQFRWVESVGHAAASDDEAALIRLATRDVTARVVAEIERDHAVAALRESERRYRWIAENASDMVAVLSPDGTHLWVSPSCRALTGYTPEELVGRTVWEFLHPADLVVAGDVVDAANAAGGHEQRLTSRFRHKDGHYLWVESVGHAAVTDEDGPQIRVSTRDVTARVAAEAERDAALAELRLLVDHAPIGMCVVDGDGMVVQVNEALCRLTGYTADQLAGLNFLELTHPDDVAATLADLRSIATGEVAMSSREKQYLRADGETIWAERTITRVAGAPGGRPLYVVQLLDLTDNRASTLFATMAMTDALTGLPNRVVLDDRLAHALTVARRVGTKVGLIFCDLDRFKEVNDTMGHDAGDELLRQVADRIRATIRESDTGVRLGGDEFVVMCENIIDDEPVRHLAERLQLALDQPYALAAGTGDVSVSIGTAVGDGPTAAALLQLADESMYGAKRAASAGIDI